MNTFVSDHKSDYSGQRSTFQFRYFIIDGFKDSTLVKLSDYARRSISFSSDTKLWSHAGIEKCRGVGRGEEGWKRVRAGEKREGGNGLKGEEQ